MNATSIRKRIGSLASAVWYGLCRFDIEFSVALIVAIFIAIVQTAVAILRSAIFMALLITVGGVLALAWYDFDLLRRLASTPGRYDASDVRTAITVFFWLSIVGGLLRVSLHDIGVFLNRWVAKVFSDRRLG